MSAPPYMRLYWGDYHKATRHLMCREHGAYLLLISEAWERGGALPDDDAKLASWARCTPQEWAEIKPVVMDFFALKRGKWVHNRVAEELAVYESTSRKRKEAGKKGGSASIGKRLENPQANASVLPTKPEPESTSEPNKDLSVGPGPTEGGEIELEQPEPAKPKGWQADEDFIAVWDGATDQMRKRSTRDKAWAAWRVATKSTPASLIRTAMPIYKLNDPDVGRTGGPGLHIWLKERKFEAHLNGQAALAQAKAPAVQFEGPVELRRRVVALTSEDFAASWLDRCSWDAESRTLTAMGKIAAQRLEQELGGYFRQWRVTIAAPGNVVAFPGGQGAVA